MCKVNSSLLNNTSYIEFSLANNYTGHGQDPALNSRHAADEGSEDPRCELSALTKGFVLRK